MSQSLFRDFQPLAAIATTPAAVQTLHPLCQLLGAPLWVPETLTVEADVQVYAGSLKTHIAKLWPDHQGLIFALATGAVVRLIAPLLEHKSQDPAVVVIDEAGKFVLSLCSGHLGGADQLTRLLALELGATPVITGAAAATQTIAIDTLGLPFGWQRGSGDWNRVSAAIARREPVQVLQEVGSTLWQDHLPDNHPFSLDAELATTAPKARVWISATQRRFAESSETDLPKVQWHPRVLWLGIGCERGTSRDLIETAIQRLCQANHLAEAAIAGVATLDLKADESGLITLCRDRHWPMQCYSAEQLRQVQVPNPSDVVAAAVGTPSVAEAAALVAASAPNLLVAKTIWQQADQPGAVTIAIAQAAQEYTGRQGQLLLVGMGPGRLDQMTPAAQAAVTQADVVIGYSLYVDLVRSLLRPGQIVEPSPITQERQRAQRAIALAQWGLTVAVVSSGDAGIYGMAGLVLEELQNQGWNGKTPRVEIFPGVSALQAAASRVGTPLMHDFCAISLSDRLTPWQVIEQRLIAAAQGDFITALYNPRSQERVEQIIRAQQIFLQHRQPETPVAIVRSAYRPDEQTALTTLAQLQDAAIDMLTTVVIGNASTRIYEDWMITPRGYLGF